MPCPWKESKRNKDIYEKTVRFGKITVIKSLLESQLVYNLSDVPTTSHQM